MHMFMHLRSVNNLKDGVLTVYITYLHGHTFGSGYEPSPDALRIAVYVNLLLKSTTVAAH